MPSTVRLNHKQQCGSGHAMNKKAPVSGAFVFSATLTALRQKQSPLGCGRLPVFATTEAHSTIDR